MLSIYCFIEKDHNLCTLEGHFISGSMGIVLQRTPLRIIFLTFIGLMLKKCYLGLTTSKLEKSPFPENFTLADLPSKFTSEPHPWSVSIKSLVHKQ